MMTTVTTKITQMGNIRDGLWHGVGCSGADIVWPMSVPIILLDLLPVVGGVMFGLAIIFRGRIARSLSRNSTSLMNFSSLGRLRCVCGSQLPGSLPADRRHFCRTCGCEVIAQDEARLNRHISPKQIKAMTSSLRRAAVRASHLQVPPSVTTMQELHRYLDSRVHKLPVRVAGRSGRFRSSPNVP
jgi:hypothetical protein